MKSKTIQFEMNGTKYSIGRLCKRGHSIHHAIELGLVSKELILDYLDLNQFEFKTLRYSIGRNCILCGFKLEKKRRNNLKERVFQILFELYQVNGCNGYPNECSSNMNESNPSFHLSYLNIDHVENNGFIERKKKKVTIDFYNEIIELYEEGGFDLIKKKYQVLCWNCNELKGCHFREENAVHSKIND